MTVAAAQAAAASLRDALQDYGVRTSIELQPGVGPKADPWGPAPFVRNLGHHVASYPPGTPGLAVVKNGRKGASPLQGPLANCYGGFDLIARIITMGWANHPGAGGPWSVPGWGTVPKDNGRPYILGWEFEGGYLPYTDEMHDFMARCSAASLDWLGAHNRREPAPLECHDEHKGWAGPRKPDRIGYTTASGRQRIAAVRGRPAPSPRPVPRPLLEELDMFTQIAPGETRKIPVPSGRKYRINVVSDSVIGQQVYGKQVSPGRVVGLFFGHPFGTGDKEWELYVGETHNIEIPCSATSFVEVTNLGRPDPAQARPIAVSLTVAP